MGRGARWRTAAIGALLSLALMAPAAAGAAVRYAAPGATGLEPCNPAPCSFSNAVQGHSPTDIHDGDQVIVAPGSYTSAVTINKGLDVGGQPGQPVPTLTTPGVGVNVDANGALLHDFRINGGSDALTVIVGKAERVYTSSTSGRACGLYGGTILDSVCLGASFGVIGLFSTASAGVTKSTIRNVTAIGGFSAGIEVTAQTGGKASLDALNVIAVGGTDVTAQTDSNPGSQATLTLGSSDYTTHSIANHGSVTDPDTNGNLAVAPLFVNPSGGDFHELAGSPTIDAGLAAPDIGSLDLDHTPRSQPVCLGGVGHPDIGAYEIAPPVASPTCSVFSIGKLKLNKHRGTAKLHAHVPGAGTLRVAGRGLRKRSAHPKKAGDVALALQPTGKAKRRLAHRGRVKLRLKLTWAPTGNTAATKTRVVRLREK